MIKAIPTEAIMKAMDLIKKKYTHWAIIIVKKAIVVSMATAPKNLRSTIKGRCNPFIITKGRTIRHQYYENQEQGSTIQGRVCHIAKSLKKRVPSFSLMPFVGWPQMFHQMQNRTFCMLTLSKEIPGLYLNDLEFEIFSWKLFKQLHCVSGESILWKKYVFIEKSKIFTQSLRNFVKMRSIWVPHFDKIS